MFVSVKLMNSDKSDKIHGDKLESTAEEGQKAETPARSAFDQLEIPPHDQPQTDGGTKIQGDKLDPHSTKQTS